MARITGRGRYPDGPQDTSPKPEPHTMNNAPAPESEQAGSGRVMRFCWDLQNSGSSLPQRGVHGFDDLLRQPGLTVCRDFDGKAARFERASVEVGEHLVVVDD